MKKILNVFIILLALLPIANLTQAQTFYVPGVHIAVNTYDNSALSFEVVFNDNLLPYFSELRDLEFDVTITDKASHITTWEMPNFSGDCINFDYIGHGGIYKMKKWSGYRGCGSVTIEWDGIDTRMIEVAQPGIPSSQDQVGGDILNTDSGYIIEVFNVRARYVLDSGAISPWYNIAPSSGSYSTILGGNDGGSHKLSSHENPENFLADFELYPNPSNGIFTISSVEFAKSIAVYNSIGKLLKHIDTNSTSIETTNLIDLIGYNKGIYNIVVTNINNEQIHKKLVLH